MDELSQSHIAGNVPSAADFDAIMKRDLATKLCPQPAKCEISYSLFRKEATQTGIAYPKFYAWVIAKQGDIVIAEGAARLAAVERRSFYLTDFATRAELRAGSEKIAIFPVLLREAITQRANQ